MKVVGITGSSGLVGANLIRELLRRYKSIHIKALVRTYTKSIDGLDVERIKGDLLNIDSLEALVRGCEVIFHLGASISIYGSSPMVYRTNVEGTSNMIYLALKHHVKRFIHFSTVHSLDPEPVNEPIDETRPLIRTPKWNYYDYTKAVGEELVLKGVKEGLPAIILNPSAMIGPYDFKPSLVGSMLILIAEGKIPLLVRGGYDWVDVRDVVNASINSIERGRIGERYILSGTRLSLKGIAQIISTYFETKPPLIEVPVKAVIPFLPLFSFYYKITKKRRLLTKEALNTLSHFSCFINNKAKEELGFSSRPIEETIKDAINWFIDNGMCRCKPRGEG